jgi:hypothetical protein
MHTTCPPNGTATIKFFNVSEPPRMRRINYFIEEATIEEIRTIAQYEELDFSTTARELMDIGLRFYQFKRGTLNPNNPNNDKLIYCQVCGQLTKVRKMHTTRVINEDYKFCEDCFFADKHKKFVIAMIQRS